MGNLVDKNYIIEQLQKKYQENENRYRKYKDSHEFCAMGAYKAAMEIVEESKVYLKEDRNLETFSIIDTNKLNKKIAEFVCKNNFEPYIFANKDTIEVLSIKEVTLPTKMLNEKTSKYLVGKYSDNKIFEDNSKSFGEVELR